MTFLKLRRNLPLAALAASLALTLSTASAAGQQVTYYNFDTPATATNPQQYSYGCIPGSSSNPLFCFNYYGIQDPTFIQDPASPNPYAVQMTVPETNQAASMWFSVPQNVANGFNLWFQFRITPASPTPTADGLAFVIQNALGGGTDLKAKCDATGQGPTALGGDGGCMGYGGIPNSVALEFDTYDNSWDPIDIPGSADDNHIALQSCGLNDGAPQPNSPAHTGSLGNCLISLSGQNGALISTLISNPQTSAASPASPVPVTLADGNAHQVVVVYNGPLDTPANTISVYLDPQFNQGTLTPVTGSTPIFTGPFDITQYMNLTNGNAYIGFTSGTGSAFETHELMGWTFTPHSTVSQTQPLPANNQGGTTTFNFGTHTYQVTYPNGAPTDGITMGVIANTISPINFGNLIGDGPTQYNGSACQVYDDTGGNCIIYSVYCYETGSPSSVVACPLPNSQGTLPTDCSSSTASDCIDLTSSYNNSIQPISPGYLQGDPLYSPITSIVGNGTTATVTCTGECAVTAGQYVTILDSSDNEIPAFTNIQVASVGSTPNIFTFSSSFNGTDNGGFITSNNVQNIFQSYTPQNLDGSSTGKTPSYSDFVVTGTTMIGSQTQLSAPNNYAATQNEAEELTATVSAPTTGPTGLPLLPFESILNTGAFTVYPGNTLNGTVSFSDSNGPISDCQTVALTAVVANNITTYQAQCSYQPPSTGQDMITATYSGDTYHSGSSNTQTLQVNPQTVPVTISTSPANLTFEVIGPTALSSGTYTSQQTLNWNIGTQYALFAPSPQAGSTGTQYVSPSWNSSGTASDTVIASANTTSYVADFTTQYLLTATAGAGGTVTVPNGYYNAASIQSIVATPNSGYVFSGWTGGTTGAIASTGSASTTIMMNAPETITATFTAVAAAGISPTSINLGTLYLGAIVTKTITVTNTGAAPMTISDPRIAILPGTTIGNLSEFITLNLCPKTLAVGKSCIMTVTFIAGPFYGQQNASLSITDSAAGSPQTVPLTVNVIDPQASFSPGSLSFGSVKTNSGLSTKSIVLTSSGGTPLSISNIAITGDTTDFINETDNCPVSSNPSVSLAPKANCTISVTFKPLSKGAHSASVVVTDNTQKGSQSAPLSGTGN